MELHLPVLQEGDSRPGRLSVQSTNVWEDSGTLRDSYTDSSGRELTPSRDHGSVVQQFLTPFVGEDSPFMLLSLLRASPIPSRTLFPSDC